MARRKTRARRYTNQQRREVLRRVKAGQTQTAIAAKTGIPAATIGYWSHKAQEASPSAGRTRTRRKRGRPATRGRRVSTPSRPAEIAWALDGDTLVIRVPLRNFARQIAEKALAKI